MTETADDRNDGTVLLLNRMLDSMFRATALSKEKQTGTESIVCTDRDGNDTAVFVYGFKTVRLAGTATFDALAADHLGDPSLGPLVAYYNKIQNEHGVEAGTEIRIPVLEKTRGSLGNRIYAVPEMQDTYGRDIALDSNGDFAVSCGDFAAVYGRDNLAQAVGNRLATSGGKRIRMGAYGIRAATGDTLSLNSFLLASIEQTVSEDPRIERVDAVEFSGIKDTLRIRVTYTDIAGNRDTHTGEI